MTAILDVCRAFGIKLNAHNFTHCPLGHKDKTPSFKVYPDTPGQHCIGSYTCFSCGAGGDAISLYARLKGIDNKEAFKELMRGEARPTRRQIWMIEQEQAFGETVSDIRNQILDNFSTSRKAVIQAANGVDMNNIPDDFWYLVSIHADDEIKLDICDSLNDVDLWRWWVKCRS